MLIRLVIENIFSFGERKEFNMLPNKKLKTLKDHICSYSGIDTLKLSSIYGANGAGKSNLIKALRLFQQYILIGEMPIELVNSQFKFFKDRKDIPQLFAIEFIQGENAYVYELLLKSNIVEAENLYISGLGKKEDKLLFERQTISSKETELKFLDEFEGDEKSRMLKSVLLEEFINPTEPILKLISNRDNVFLQEIKQAYRWFNESLQIVVPASKPNALAHVIDKDKQFKEFAEDLMCSFNIGISELKAAKKEITEFFGKENTSKINDIIKEVERSPKKKISVRTSNGDELIIEKELEKFMVKILKVGHKDINNNSIFFDLFEESDGTVRLLDFMPAFKNVIANKKVYIIDEIERSIHPLLIKELIKKFSLDTKTKGQLIFTTHESNLLDQSIFRQDEIWFAEKDKTGSTDLYSLNDFKEHKTIDIRKGYLNGRYGSIPFLGNLQDLNWNEYDTDQ